MKAPNPPPLPSPGNERIRYIDNPVRGPAQGGVIPQGPKILYIRGMQGIEPLNTKVTEWNLKTICPQSLAWYIYLKFLGGRHFFEFIVRTVPFENITDPQFTIGDHIYLTLDAFVASLPLLEPREMQEIPGTQEEKESLMEAITELEMACLLACQSLCSQSWITGSLNSIRNEKQIMHIAVENLCSEVPERMQRACETLTLALGNNVYLLDAWWAKCRLNRCDYPLAVVDAKFAACIILIKRLFEVGTQSSFQSEVKSILLQHLSIRTQADIFYALYLKKKTFLDYTPKCENNPNILENALAGLEPQGSGSNGRVYRVQLEDDNEWNLDQGEYCFKIPKDVCKNINLQVEITSLTGLPFSNVNKLLGFATPDNGKYFLVMPWLRGGDLSSRIQNLTWIKMKEISKGIAYAVYVVHRTPGRQCICDLKPENILLDENDKPVLCDMTTHCHGAAITGAGGTREYNDGKSVASFKFDVFSYGMTLFKMLLKEDIVNVRVDGNELSERIHGRLAESTDILEIMKPRLVDPLGDEEKELARRLVILAGRCTRKEEEARPSTLDILQELDKMFPDIELVDV